MIKVIVSGACGKMGKAIVQAVMEHKDMQLRGALERRDHPFLGKDIGEIIAGAKSGIELSSHLEEIIGQADVLIEFTTPIATLEHLEIARQYKKAMLIGTTGFNPAQRKKIETCARKIPCLVSANMSRGINLLFYLLENVAKILGQDYDIEIVEAHHRQKKDAPSGTALHLAKIICQALNWDMEKTVTYGRKGIIGERKRKELGIHVIRGGDIFGEHRVIFAGKGERLQLIHDATSRDCFVEGAIKSVFFLANASPGFYSMEDILAAKKGREK